MRKWFVEGAALLAVLMGFATISLAQESSSSSSPAADEAKEGYLKTCLHAAADMSPIYPTDTFPADMSSICAVFKLGEEESYITLGSSWVAVDVGDVAPPNTVVAQFDLRLQGLRASQFVYSQTGPMPPGKYRLDVTADGKPWKSASFTVLTRQQTPKPALNQVRDLMPVIEGKTWEYDFVQEGVNVSIPGIEPDAEGKLRAKVKMTVGAVEPIGIHVRTTRNEKPSLDEWWRVTEGGIFTVRSAEPDGRTVIFQPPLMWLPFPPESPKLWTYQARGNDLKQIFQMWGTVPLATPQGGEKPGYVVVCDQQVDTLTRVTMARYYVPGIGMTRETAITAFNDELLRRQDMTLVGISGDGKTSASTPGSQPNSTTAP